MSLLKIDNPAQLRQLQVRYAQMEGANATAQVALQAAQSLAKQYIEALGMLTGLSLHDGQRVTVDWDTGDVSVTEHEHSTNGVAAT